MGQRQQRTKVGVAGHQHTILGPGACEHLVVLGALEPDVEGVYRVMPGFTQQLGESRRTVLIDEEPHAVVRNGSSRSATVSAA